MKRRLVVLTCLLGVVGGSAGAALAADSAGTPTTRNEVCLVLAKDGGGNHTQDFCITWPGALQHR